MAKEVNAGGYTEYNGKTLYYERYQVRYRKAAGSLVRRKDYTYYRRAIIFARKCLQKGNVVELFDKVEFRNIEI